MKIEKLIEVLEKMPVGTDVHIFDWKKNLHHADSDPTGEGIYPDFKIEKVGKEFTDTPFVALTFQNDDYDDNGKPERLFSEHDIHQLQSKIHKITGDGEVMKIFNKMLGIQAG